MRRTLLLLCLGTLSCASNARQSWAEKAYPGDFDTRLGKTWRTPTGIAVDGEANPHEIDWYVDVVFECLETAVPGTLTHTESRQGLCFAEEGRREPFVYPAREDMVVKIGDWHPSCANPKRQVLNVEVPKRFGCDPNKPRPEGCPAKCYWRGGFRYENDRYLYITVPEFSMFPDTLVRSVTACLDPYVIQRIKACLAKKSVKSVE